MRQISIHGRIGKISRAANVVQTIGIAKPGKSASLTVPSLTGTHTLRFTSIRVVDRFAAIRHFGMTGDGGYSPKTVASSFKVRGVGTPAGWRRAAG